MSIQKIINNFEKKHNGKVVYLINAGSILYVTDNENSDTDFTDNFILEQLAKYD